jgi:hypothetical protein
LLIIVIDDDDEEEEEEEEELLASEEELCIVQLTINPSSTEYYLFSLKTQFIPQSSISCMKTNH